MQQTFEKSNRRLREKVGPYISIARPDHWFKNIFVVPGIIVAYSFDPGSSAIHLSNILWGFVSICLIASSNYVINEILDAPTDVHHPLKKNRPIPAGQVNLLTAYTEWLVLMGVGMGVACHVSPSFSVTMLCLWLMGCIYNIRPIRTKEKAILDVVSEAVNNPLRLLAGWFLVSPWTVPPVSLIICYWSIGCFFMAIKRLAEFRLFEAGGQALYRRSFQYYTEPRLMVSIMFYASASMLFFGLFAARYRLELILSFPLIALLMAFYLALGFQPNSIVQTPEKLYRNPTLMVLVMLCVLIMISGVLIDIPLLHELFVSRPLSIRPASL